MYSSVPFKININPPSDIYVADQLPPDWNIAKNHSRAVRPGYPIQEFREACPCCLNYVQKQKIPYLQDYVHLGFLGEGFPLFYNFMKFCIIMLFVLSIDNAATSLTLSDQENQCEDLFSQRSSNTTTGHRLMAQTITCGYSIANEYAYISPNRQTNTRRMVKIVSFLGQLVILLYFREKQTNLAEYLGEKNCILSDYTMFIDGIPKRNFNNKNRLMSLIKRHYPQGEVMDVLIIEDCRQFHIMSKQLQKIVQEKKNAIKKNQQERVEELTRLYAHQESSISDFVKLMREKENTYFIGSAFVIMNTEAQKKQAIQILNHLPAQNIQEFFENYDPIHGKMQAIDAREPTEIMWNNIHFTRKFRHSSILMGWLVTVLVLAALTAVFFFIVKEKSHLIKQSYKEYISDPKRYWNRYRAGIALGFVSIILVNLFNKFVLSEIAHKITEHEKHLTYTSLQESFALKYMLGMFFTTALMTLVVESIIYKNYTYTFGVVDEETLMFIFNAGLPPLIMLINPQFLFYLVQRRKKYGDNSFTQGEANLILEYPTYDIGKRYAEILKTMWFTALYVSLIPLGALFSLAGVVLYYAVDKHVLLSKSSVKGSISRKLSKRMISWLDFTLILKPMGQLIFDSQIRGIVEIEDIVMLCVGVIYQLLPLDRIISHLFRERFALEREKYQDTKARFPVNYFTLYPLRRHEIIKELPKQTIELIPQSRQGSMVFLPSRSFSSRSEERRSRMMQRRTSAVSKNEFETNQVTRSASKYHSQIIMPTTTKIRPDEVEKGSKPELQTHRFRQ